MKRRRAELTGCGIPTLDVRTIPQYERQNVAQIVFDAVQREFQRPEVREDYERWKEERRKRPAGAGTPTSQPGGWFLTAHHQKFNTEWEDLQMKKKITGSVLSAGAIVLGLAAAGCGGAIENAANGWAMLGYTLLAILLGCAALALAGLGLVAEQRKEPQKIHKVPENTVKKAVCGRKAG